VYGREPVLPGDSLRPYVSKEENQDDKSVFARTAKELEDLGQARAAAEFRAKSYAAKAKERWDAVIKPVGFDVGELVLLRLEQRYGLEYNWEGPYRALKKNDETDVYQLETFGGVAKKDWVHADRLKKVKTVDKILDTKLWFDVAASRARWPAGDLRDHSIVDMSSVLPELTMEADGEETQLEADVEELPIQVEAEEVPLQVEVDREQLLPPEEDVAIGPVESTKDVVPPEVRQGVDSKGVDKHLEFDADKMFDCDMDELAGNKNKWIKKKKKEGNW
jgi:hypothetical protein